MPITFGNTDYNEIRSLLETGLDSTLVTDDELGSSVYFGIAKIKILEEAGLTEAQYDAKTDSQKLKIKVAIKYRIAALKLTSFYRMKSEGGDASNTYEDRSWLDVVKSWEATINSLVKEVTSGVFPTSIIEAV